MAMVPVVVMATVVETQNFASLQWKTGISKQTKWYMADLFNHRYRVPSARASWWNYGNNGTYFITICTINRVHYFGKIVNKQMELSKIGHQAQDCWIQIPFHFPFVELGAFIIMPNHVHGIIIIDKEQPPNQTMNQFGPQSQNLGSIVRGFKTGVSKYCRLYDISFGWQTRYHDHIIRNQIEFERISNYILNNPANWIKDVHNK